MLSALPTNSLRTALFALSLPVASLGLGACAGGPARQSVDPGQQQAQVGTEELGETLVVRGSLKLTPKSYLRPTPERAEAVITLEGLRGVTLDLTGVTLRGAGEGTAQESHRGTGILLRDCRDVQIVGGTLGGYRVCIAIEDSRDVHVDGVTFEGWYGQRLASTIASEAEVDRIDMDTPGPSWRGRYGAALWIGGSELVQVHGCKGRHGQNGILMVESGHCDIYDNDFSFLSGWGIGLWNSSANRVAHNILDYNVRGYSHDVYVGQQNAAALLLMGGSSDNAFVQNSATHCGTGALVLGDAPIEGTASLGQIRTGGCDRNTWIENDFRYDVNAGFRIVRSSGNVILRNLLSGALGAGLHATECGDTQFVGNEVEDVRRRGIVLEGCQEFLVADNSLRNDQIGIEVAGSDAGVSSRDHWFQENDFSENDQDLVLKDSRRLVFNANRYPATARTLYVEDIEIDGLGSLGATAARRHFEGAGGSRPSGFVQRTHILQWNGEDHPALYEARSRRPKDVRGNQSAFKHAGSQLGPLSSILVAEYGPWDFRSGEVRPEVRFPGGVLSACQWDAVWFHWEPASDPRGERDVWRARRFTHVARDTVDNFRNPWGSGQIRQALGLQPFGLIATTDLEVETTGTYRLTVISDDGVHIKVDGKSVLEDWVWHPRPKKHTTMIRLEAGVRRLSLEYFQVEGAAALSLDLERVDA